jgi:DNA-binding beta-propeller fold protein YncE
VTTLAGTAGTYVAADGTNLYVTDTESYTIRKIVISTAEVTTLAGSPGWKGNDDGRRSAARFDDPMGITTDGIKLYVADFANHTIRVVTE